jgi:Phosphotransferase enzyme family
VELIGRGRTADVYALGPGTVLRRYRAGQDVVPEAALMRHLHEHRFPVARVLEAGGPDLVMERLEGPTLLASLLDGGTAVEEGATVLAGLHTSLRQVPLPGATSDGRVSVVHLDLHPGNVVLDRSRGPVVIDWANAETGPGNLDPAMTAVIVASVAHAPAGSELALAAGHLRPLLTEFLSVFLRAVGGDPLAQLDEAERRRSSDPALSPSERATVGAAAQQVRRLLRHTGT